MNNNEIRPKRVAIIGAGPAGLTAAYTLLKKDKRIQVTVLEADSEYVGGISRTVKYKDFRFDIGGHRFFSKSKEVEDFWTEILPNDMLDRPRSSISFGRISVQKSSTSFDFEKKRCPPMSKRKSLYLTVREMPPTYSESASRTVTCIRLSFFKSV